MELNEFIDKCKEEKLKWAFTLKQFHGKRNLFSKNAVNKNNAIPMTHSLYVVNAPEYF